MDDIPSSWELDNDDECTATEGSPEDRVGFNVMEDGSVEIGGETWGSTACATLPPPPPPGGTPSTLFGLPIAEFAALVAGGILAVAFLLFCMCKLCEGDGQADQARRMNIQEQQRQQRQQHQQHQQRLLAQQQQPRQQPSRQHGAQRSSTATVTPLPAAPSPPNAEPVASSPIQAPAVNEHPSKAILRKLRAAESAAVASRDYGFAATLCSKCDEITELLEKQEKAVAQRDYSEAEACQEQIKAALAAAEGMCEDPRA